MFVVELRCSSCNASAGSSRAHLRQARRKLWVAARALGWRRTIRWAWGRRQVVYRCVACIRDGHWPPSGREEPTIPLQQASLDLTP